MYQHVKLLAITALTCVLSFSAAQAQHVTKIKAADFLTNGESFFQASNITTELTRLARADGYIGSGENFKTVSVSGASIASIVNQYKSANPKPVYLVSDGAGIDLMNSSDIAGLSNTLKKYLDEMKKGGTKKLLWMIYPDPQGGSWATLKKNQDLWAVAVPPIIHACTSPKTLLIDLRPVWAGHYSQYTTDGIHCTNAGGTATAEAFWKIMKDSSFFDTGSVTTPVERQDIARTAPAPFMGFCVSNNSLNLSMNLAKPSAVTMRITTVSGKLVAGASKNGRVSGLQTIQFPLGGVAPGVYCLEVKTGQLSKQSSLLLR
jgi:hypothetical protein